MVKSDRWLVQNVEHAPKSGADLRCQPNPLTLPPGQRIGCAIEAEIVQADGIQKLQSIADFANDASGNLLLPATEFQIREEPQSLSYRPRNDFRNRSIRDLDGKTLRPQASAAAGRARFGDHKVREVLGNESFLFIITIENIDNTFHTSAAFLDSVKDRILNFRRQLFKRKRQICAQLLRNLRNLHFKFVVEPADGHAKTAVQNGSSRIGDDTGGIEIKFHPQAIADLAGTINAVEGKSARFNGRDTQSAVGACHLFRVQALLTIHNGDEDDALCQFDGLLDRSLESFVNILLDHQSVDNDLNGVILFLIEVDRFVEIMQHTVNAAADIAGLGQCLKLFLELAFAAANDRSKDHHACAFRQGL